jgi:hypothetical protein
MPAHLTDIACLEWIRHRKITLAPETTFGVETHLSGCSECRQKLAHFEALERSFQPYGSEMPAPRALRLGKVLKVSGVVVAIAVVVAVIAKLA